MLNIPTEKTPIEKMPAEKMPIENMPVANTPTEKVPAAKTPAEKLPAPKYPPAKSPALRTGSPAASFTPATTRRRATARRRIAVIHGILRYLNELSPYYAFNAGLTESLLCHSLNQGRILCRIVGEPSLGKDNKEKREHTEDSVHSHIQAGHSHNGKERQQGALWGIPTCMEADRREEASFGMVEHPSHDDVERDDQEEE